MTRRSSENAVGVVLGIAAGFGFLATVAAATGVMERVDMGILIAIGLLWPLVAGAIVWVFAMNQGEKQ